MDEAATKNADTRTCTCHPDDNPPNPCTKKYALTECRISELMQAAEPFIEKNWGVILIVEYYQEANRLEIAIKNLERFR